MATVPHECQTTVKTLEGDERLFFVNAWNEWAAAISGC